MANNRHKCKYAYRLGGGNPPMLSFKEGASASFAAGEFVKLVTDSALRRLQVCAPSGETEILGQVQSASTGTAGTEHNVLLAEPSVIFKVNIYHTTAASAVSAETQLGVTYGLVTSSNKDYCAIDDITTDAMLVVQHDKDQATGTQYADVYVRILPDVYQLTKEKTA